MPFLSYYGIGIYKASALLEEYPVPIGKFGR